MINNTNPIWLVIEELKRYKIKIIFITILLLISSIFGLTIPLVNQKLVDDGILKGNFNHVCKLTAIGFGIYLLKLLTEFVYSYLITYINSKIRFSLYQKTFYTLENLKIKYFTHKKNTEIYNNINSDINNISKLFDNNILTFISQVIYFIGGIILMSLINWKISMLVILFIPIKYFGVSLLGNIGKKISNKYIEISAEYAEWFADTIEGIKDVKIYNLFKSKEIEFEEKKEKMRVLETKSGIVSAIKSQYDQMNIQVVVLLIYLIGAKMIFSEHLSYGELTAILSYLTYINLPISYFLSVKFIYATIKPSINRLHSFLKEEKESNTGCSISTDKKDLKIKFENVSFSYGSNKKIFKNLSFDIKTGEKVAIIGDNGVGKTTILSLLLRFYEPQEGKIILGNTNIQEFKLNQYRELFAVNGVDSHLFNCTVDENIVFQKKQNKFLKYRICTLDGGMNCKNLSSGEKQKILLERSLQMKRPIVILDEATAHIDKKSRTEFEIHFNEIFKKSTVIIIAHTSEILKYVDKIIEITINGAVVYKSEDIDNIKFTNLIDKSDVQINT